MIVDTVKGAIENFLTAREDLLEILREIHDETLPLARLPPKERYYSYEDAIYDIAEVLRDAELVESILMIKPK